MRYMPQVPYHSCKELNGTKSGLYYIRNKAISKKPFQVFCDGGWTVIQRRVDNSTDFYLNWRNYKNGFGNLSHNFWIGLRKLHLMTSGKPHTLRISVEDFDGNRREARYFTFEVGSEKEDYALKVLGGYFGNAGDSLKEGRKFTTYDKNIEISEKFPCNEGGGWWSGHCGLSNLNGIYKGRTENDCTNIYWARKKGNCESLKFSQMTIRYIKSM